MKKISSNTKRLVIRLAVYSAAAIFALIYILFLRDTGCVIYAIFKKPCFSCGATRAAFNILRGNFVGAVNSHVIFTLAVYPIGAIIVIQDFITVVICKIKNIYFPSMLEYLFQK